jgi:uncharacterized membrane protein
MFTPPGYRKRLMLDVERWAGAGLISRSAADAIVAEYKANASHALVTVLAFVFAILAGAGLIALVAANWQEIPREVRVTGVLLLNVAVLGACLAFSLRRPVGSLAIETAAALSVVSAAASMSLIGQIYHFPSNWPGFGLAMTCIGCATALVARSTACIWLAAVAQFGYYLLSVSETPGGLFGHASGVTRWTQEDWIFLAVAAILIGVAISRWTARSGPWTIFVAVWPMVWWINDVAHAPFTSAPSLPWLACGVVAAVLLSHERRASDRCDAAASALIGLFAIGVALFALHDLDAPSFAGPMAGIPALQALLAVAAAMALAVTAFVRGYADRAALAWLAAALAAPFIAGVALPATATEAQLATIARLVLVVLLPLALLAIEARISDRRKTFAFVITAMIAIVCLQLTATKDLLTFAWVFLGGSAVLGAIIVARRMLSAPARDAVAAGAE